MNRRCDATEVPIGANKDCAREGTHEINGLHFCEEHFETYKAAVEQAVEKLKAAVKRRNRLVN